MTADTHYQDQITPAIKMVKSWLAFPLFWHVISFIILATEMNDRGDRKESWIMHSISKGNIQCSEISSHYFCVDHNTAVPQPVK